MFSFAWDAWSCEQDLNRQYLACYGHALTRDFRMLRSCLFVKRIKGMQMNCSALITYIGRQTIPDLERHLTEQFDAQKLSMQNVCAAVTDGGKNFVGATKNQLLASNGQGGDQAEFFHFHLVCICHKLNTALLNVLSAVNS